MLDAETAAPRREAGRLPARFALARFLGSLGPALDLAYGAEIEGDLPEGFTPLLERLRAGPLGEGARPGVGLAILETA